MRSLPHWSGLLTLCVLLSAAPPAQAENAELHRRLLAATQLFEELEYERALQQLESARALALNTEENALIAIYQGIILADSGKPEQATSAFKEGLLLNPNAELPVEVSPKVESLFEAVRAEARQRLTRYTTREEQGRGKEQQRLDAERRAAEEARLRAEREVAEEARRKVEAARQAALHDAPRAQPAPQRVPVPTPAAPPPSREAYLPGPEVARPSRPAPVAPFVFGGVTLVAVGAGSYFGLLSLRQSEEARAALYQDDTLRSLQAAQQNAVAANVAFGTAGVALIATLISLATQGGEPPAPPSQEVRP